MSEKFTVRDRRGGDRYFIDNAFLRGGWGAKLGPYAIAVYNALALHVDADDQDAYPSYETISKLTSISRRQVIREVQKLEQWNIIHKTTRYVDTDEKEQTSNEYVLLNKNEWIPVPSDSQSLPLVTHSHYPSDSQSPKQDSFNKNHNNNEADSPENNIPDSNLETVSRTYEQEIGGLSPIIADSIKDALTTYPVEWITKAISRAAEMNKRRWSYVAGILKNWQVIGGPQNDKPQKEKPKYQNSARTYPTQQASKPKTKLPPGFDLDAYRKKQEESRREIYSEDNDNYATRSQGKPPTNPD